MIPEPVVADRSCPLQRERRGERLARRLPVGEGSELPQVIGLRPQDKAEFTAMREIGAHARIHGDGLHDLRGQGWTSTRRSETATSV